MAEPLRRTSSAKEVDDEQDDYDDDDFEDYSDDGFESEGEASPARPPARVPVPTKPVAVATNATGGAGRRQPPPVQRSPSKNAEELAALRDALASENQAALTRKPGSDSSPAPSPRTTRVPQPIGPAGSSRTTARAAPKPMRQLPERGTITIASPIRKSGRAGRGRRALRVRQLSELVTLSEERFDLFSHPPASAHDLYLNKLRSGALRQTACQYNDDDRSIAVQTEPAETKDAGMHFPDDIGFGGSAPAGSDSSAMAAQSMRLSRFLHRAAATCELLLEENLEMAETERRAGRASESKSDGSFSTETIKIRLPRGAKSSVLLERRELVDVCFSSAAQHELLAAFGPAASAAVKVTDELDVVAQGGLLCLFDAHNLKAPKFGLVCPGTPTCCTMSPHRSHVAVAGTAQGSLVLWDLRESNKMHRSDASVDLGLDTGLRRATYSTDALADCGHSAGIVTVVALAASGAGGAGGAGGGDDRSAFQVASLDDRGYLTFWVTVEVSVREGEVSETDLGLGIGARLKLVKSGTVSSIASPVTRRPRAGSDESADDEDDTSAADVGPSVCDVQFCPTEPARYLVGTVAGSIVHGNRFGGRLEVRTFESAAESPCTSVHFNPFNAEYFLAGYADGTIAAYRTISSTPIKVWETACSGVVRLRWSAARPAVFFVLDTEQVLQAWDLLEDDNGPLVEQPSEGKTTFAVSKASLVQTSRSSVATASKNGSVQVHVLAPMLSQARSDEVQQLRDTLEALF